MNTRNPQFNKMMVNNLIWLAASLVLAFFIWVIASNAADPVQQRRLAQSFPIQLELDPELTIINEPRRNASVTVRAQQSVLNLLTPDDVTVYADLRGLDPGTHTVELEPRVARRVLNADTQPVQITVELDAVQSQQLEVQGRILAPPPTGFQVGDPTFSESQVLATGPASSIQRVIAAQATLNLDEQRATYESIVPLVPIDEEGRVVQDVTLEPDETTVTVEISLPQNVAEVPVFPNIDLDSLPEGYDLVRVTQDLPTVVVSGNLARIPDALETEPISLQGRTDDFDVTVPIMLPSGRISILGDQQQVNVSIDIEPRIITRQFEDVPVTFSGQADGLDVQNVTTQVTLLITGAQADLGVLNSEDLRAVVDLTDLTPGTYDLVPTAFNGQVQLSAENISVSPPTIAVTITQPAEATEEPAG